VETSNAPAPDQRWRNSRAHLTVTAVQLIAHDDALARAKGRNPCGFRLIHCPAGKPVLEKNANGYGAGGQVSRWLQAGRVMPGLQN
jgi:hypothetical protein